MNSNLPVDDLVLCLLSKHDGEWGWYQLARELGRRGHGNINARELLIDLTNRDLVAPDGNPKLAATHYRVTESGKKKIDEKEG